MFKKLLSYAPKLFDAVPSSWLGPIAAAAAILVFTTGCLVGYGYGIERHVKHVEKQASATVEVVKAGHENAEQERIVYRDRVQIIREKGETIVKEVPIYVTKEDDSHCAIPDGFIRLHNRAVRGHPDHYP